MTTATCGMRYPNPFGQHPMACKGLAANVHNARAKQMYTVNTKINKEEKACADILGTQRGGPKPPQLASGKAVMDILEEAQQKENKNRRVIKQSTQPTQSYWPTQEGNMKLPLVKEPPCQHKNKICILERALYHRGAALLLQYATKGSQPKLGQPLSGRKIMKSCQADPCQVEPHQANQHQAEQEHKWKACRKKTRTITMTSNCRNQYNCAHRDWYSPIRRKQHYSSMS